MGSLLEEQDILEVSLADTKKIETFWSLINAIDFSMVRKKLMDEEEGQGWDEEFATYAEKRYTRYLCLQFLYPKKSLVPTQDIDLFWHQHILDTRAYAKDCNKIFGEFLHHFPYFGMRDEQDAKNLQNSFEETKSLYFEHFNEDLCTEYSGVTASACHKGTSTCHKCTDTGGPDTIKCSRCR